MNKVVATGFGRMTPPKEKVVIRKLQYEGPLYLIVEAHGLDGGQEDIFLTVESAKKLFEAGLQLCNEVIESKEHRRGYKLPTCRVRKYT